MKNGGYDLRKYLSEINLERLSFAVSRGRPALAFCHVCFPLLFCWFFDRCQTRVTTNAISWHFATKTSSAAALLLLIAYCLSRYSFRNHADLFPSYGVSDCISCRLEVVMESLVFSRVLPMAHTLPPSAGRSRPLLRLAFRHSTLDYSLLTF